MISHHNKTMDVNEFLTSDIFEGIDLVGLVGYGLSFVNRRWFPNIRLWFSMSTTIVSVNHI